MRPKETREPERTLPLGLILAMAGAAVLYIAVAITAVSIVPWRALAAVFTVITLFAVANTALINYITASRLIYGIARQGLLPARLGTVHSSGRTPHLAIGLLLFVLMLLALLGTIAELAAATVLTLLVVFVMVNGALLILQDRKGERPGHFEVPRLVPALGALVCFVLIVDRRLGRTALAGALLLASIALYAAMRLRA